MKAYDIIKHKNSMDVCYQIIEIGEFYAWAQVINMGYEKSYMLDEYVNIPIKDKGNWLICSDQDVECLRYSEWEPL